MAPLSLNSESDYSALINMDFKATDVLTSVRDKVKRQASLLRAALLDGLDQSEVLLVVEDTKSLKKVRSRIIATGNDRVLLERGLSIPIQCILDVEFLS